jgi:hypothetical protein
MPPFVFFRYGDEMQRFIPLGGRERIKILIMGATSRTPSPDKSILHKNMIISGAVGVIECFCRDIVRIGMNHIHDASVDGALQMAN